MSGNLICPRGHQWQASADNQSGGVPTPVVCPQCGALCESPSGDAADGDPTVSAVTVPASIPPLPEDVNFAGTLRPPRVIARAIELPQVPGHEVLGRLGHGGMGAVYKARHLRLGRLVALKVILAGAHAAPQQLVRFQLEAEALASLQHPHIVQLFEVGEHEGLPYLSLELVEGGTLSQKLARKPQPPDEAARMVEKLARAVYVAHQRGIIHRDLKPPNVLLTAAGEPKITDFGLAKRLEAEDPQTQAGVLLGTPSYMAPEQASGDARAIGPLVDVYALGVILYEMLTGRAPFQGESMMDTLEQVRHREPPRPGQLQSKIPPDLEVICLKCLEKEPVKRYASALDLAEDLHRFLALEPIRARPVGRLQRLSKWVRRRPAVAALVAVSVAATLALAALGLWSVVSLRQAKARAEKRSDEARTAVDSMYTDVAVQWLVDAPDKDSVQRKFLENALRAYQEFARESGDDPEVRRKTAQAHFRTGQLYRILEKKELARSAYEQAIGLQQQLRADFPDNPDYQHDLATSYNWLGELVRENGRPRDAELNYRAALELQERLMVRFRGEAKYVKDRARSLYNLGIVCSDTGRPAEAAQSYDRAAALLEELYGRQPADYDCRQELARCYIDRGTLHRATEQPEQAATDFRRAVSLLEALRKEVSVRAEYKFELAVAYQDLGNLFFSQRKLPEALAEIDRAREVLTRLVEDFPTRPRYRKKLANTWNSHGSVLAVQGRLPEAEKSWHEALQRFRALAGDFAEVAEYRQQVGDVLGNLGWLKLELKDAAAARGLLEEGVAELRQARKLNPDNPELRRDLTNQCRSLAEALVMVGDHAAAVAAARDYAAASPDQAQVAYYAACFIARAAGKVQQDKRLASPADRATVTEKYAREAIGLLRQAFADKASNVQRLPDEKTVFGPLEAYSEVRRIMAATPTP